MEDKCVENGKQTKLLKEQLFSLQRQLEEKDRRIKQLEGMVKMKTGHIATQVIPSIILLDIPSPHIPDNHQHSTTTCPQTSQLAQPLLYFCSQALSPCVGSLC